MRIYDIFKKNKNKDEDDAYKMSPILPKEIYQAAVLDLKDVIAPSALDVKSKNIDLGDKMSRTFYIIQYPRFLSDG